MNLFADEGNYKELITELRNFDTKRIAAPSKPAIERSFEKFREIENNYRLLSSKASSPLTDDSFIDDITLVVVLQ